MLHRWRWPAAAICIAAVLAIEAYAVFENREGTFSIEGEQPYPIEEFAAGEPVRQAFLMQGAGLRGVRVLVDAKIDAPVPMAWKLWRGHPDHPGMSLAFEGIETVTTRRGQQWVEFSFARDGSSGDRWYTFETVLATPRAAEPDPAAPVLVASHDNPERGGALWVGATRKPGSLFLRADRRGQNAYRRFRTEGTPHLPRVLQIEAIQWVIFLSCHAAFVAYAIAALRDGWSS
ncbi:MAG: hypothetical protein WD690_00275 [Vicinamibacterales bacterium]